MSHRVANFAVGLQCMCGFWESSGIHVVFWKNAKENWLTLWWTAKQCTLYIASLERHEHRNTREQVGCMVTFRWWWWNIIQNTLGTHRQRFSEWHIPAATPRQHPFDETLWTRFHRHHLWPWKLSKVFLHVLNAASQHWSGFMGFKRSLFLEAEGEFSISNQSD